MGLKLHCIVLLWLSEPKEMEEQTKGNSTGQLGELIQLGSVSDGKSYYRRAIK